MGSGRNFQFVFRYIYMCGRTQRSCTKDTHDYNTRNDNKKRVVLCAARIIYNIVYYYKKGPLCGRREPTEKRIFLFCSFCFIVYFSGFVSRFSRPLVAAVWMAKKKKRDAVIMLPNIIRRWVGTWRGETICNTGRTERKKGRRRRRLRRTFNKKSNFQPEGVIAKDKIEGRL